MEIGKAMRPKMLRLKVALSEALYGQLRQAAENEDVDVAVLLRHLASKYVRGEYLMLPPHYRLRILVDQISVPKQEQL